MNAHTNRRSGKDRRSANSNVSFPLRDKHGIIVAMDRRVSCDRRTDGLQLTETNLSQKVFQAIFKKYQKLERTNMKTSYRNALYTLFFMFLSSLSLASENEETIAPLLTAPAEQLEIVLFCPDGSKYEGELVPKWVTTDEATDFFCNDIEETEIAE